MALTDKIATDPPITSFARSRAPSTRRLIPATAG